MGTVEAQDGAFLPPRATSWGDPSDRDALQQIAEDVATRAGFAVCAIEVLRSDAMLEFVAIHGTRPGRERLLGRGSPVGAMTPVFNCGADFGAFTFVAAEWLTQEALARIRRHGYVPRLQAAADDRDAWRAEDVLAARLRDGDGELRAVLYLDEPFSGMRLRPEGLLALSDELQLAFRAVVTTVERESFSQRFRLGGAARKVIRSASNHDGLEQLLEVAQGELKSAFRAVDLHIHVFGPAEREERGHAAGHGSEDLDAAIAAAARLAWTEGHVVIAEREEVWGGERLEVRHAAVLAGAAQEQGVRSIIVVPVTGSGRLLGALVIVRGDDEVRWTDSESAAALEVGHDLGQAVLDARAFEKEQQLNVELRRLDSYRTELIETVLHELKNPIGVIVGHLEMLEAWPSAPPEVRASLAAMGKGAARLETLADHLLTLSRLGGPDQGPDRVPVDLAALVRESAELTSVVSAQADVALELAGVADKVTVLGDPDDLRRVVDNLVGNAVKYSDARSTVRVGAERLDEEVLFWVSDEGLGISEEDQERLFTEFFRSTNTRALTRPGTGLGLAIVRRIVVGHGGRIEVESALGEGTTFRVWLPAG
ncbi:sensor histidine kinase [Nocardioides houyundeii]|uniref:sensor histidine kinase n=1 Tax=Nocardioides houyundeii TaxID=2045452 RepID=UPI000C76C7FB|nr:HAMP domain-containing sensor histidine kinase [Nocardioides houyundeii]